MSSHSDRVPNFPLGRLLATPGALRAIEDSGQSPADFLSRHARGDWGCVSTGDRHLNDIALDSGARLLSVYETRDGGRIWIITDAEDAEGQRQCTTILLPQDY